MRSLPAGAAKANDWHGITSREPTSVVDPRNCLGGERAASEFIDRTIFARRLRGPVAQDPLSIGGNCEVHLGCAPRAPTAIFRLDDQSWRAVHLLDIARGSPE